MNIQVYRDAPKCISSLFNRNTGCIKIEVVLTTFNVVCPSVCLWCCSLWLITS